jgi:hypothetical protein
MHAKRSGEPTRSDAKDHLQEILSALVPSQAGRGEGPKPTPAELIYRYGDYLLRWMLVLPAYEERFGTSRKPKHAQKIARLYGLPEPDVREHLDPEPKFGGKLTARKRAIHSLASALGKTDGTVEQDLKAARKARPRSNKE